MRKSITPFLLLLCCGLTGWLGAQSITYTARLNGHQEVQPIATTGTGTITAELTGNTLVVSGSFENLTSPFNPAIGGGAHIHLGYAGQNGGIVFPLVVVPSVDLLSGTIAGATNTFTLDAAQLEAMTNRQLYVNIHTVAFPGGEIRGQLRPAESEVFSASLFGSHEVPSVLTSASGGLLLELNGNTLTVTGAFQNLRGEFASEIAGGAHLHMAYAGSNGGIAVPLNAEVNEDERSGIFPAEDNTLMLDDDQVAALRERRLYANIHSSFMPSGEIRGQVTGLADIVFRAHLSGANEWPVNSSLGGGEVIGEVHGDTLWLSGSFGNLRSTVNTDIAGGAHIHTGFAGSNGGILLGLTPDLNADSLSGVFEAAENMFILEGGQLNAMLDRALYVNIHTRAFPLGEIRGQLLNESMAVFTAFLSGSQEMPDVNTPAHGMVKLEMSGARLVASGSFRELSSLLNIAIAGGAHIHAGLPGQNGPVLIPLLAQPAADTLGGTFQPDENTFPVLGTFLDTLMNRGLYVNIHSLNHPMGEIRGNLLAEATNYFIAPLSGASETATVNTEATGMANVEINGMAATLVGSFRNLQSDYAANIAGGAHIHANYAGSNGGILFPLNTEVAGDLRSGTMLADSNRVMLTEGQLDTLLARGLYANIHTADHPGGEIRGQVLPLAGTYFHTTLRGLNEVPPVLGTEANGGLKLELTGTRLIVSGSFNNLNGDFDASIAGGAHLHLAPAGENGGISLGLNATVDSMNLKGGVFQAENNQFTLTAEQVSALRADSLYANIHTTTNAMGEVRGQVLPEINLFPDISSITLPLPGADIELEGGAETAFEVNFGSVTDPDGNKVVYIWQLAADADFENILFATTTGSDTVFMTDFGTVDALLDSAGVEVGAAITLYHRAIASDGSNNTFGEAAEVTITRGMVVGVEEYRPLGFGARAYPTLNDGHPLTFEVQTAEPFNGQLLLVDQLGKVISLRDVRFTTGTQTQVLDMAALPAGMYFITLRHQGRLIHVDRVVVR